MKREPTSRDAFSPSTREATPELSMYRTLLRFITTRGVRLSRTSFSSAFRTAGDFARSMSPETSKIVVLSSCRLEICTLFFSFEPLRVHFSLRRADVLDQAETIGPIRALVFDDIHALLNKMQTESAGLYFFESSHAKLGPLYRWPAIGE